MNEEEDILDANLFCLDVVTPKRIAQTISEMKFALQLRPCGVCGTYERDPIKYHYIGDPDPDPTECSHFAVESKCPQCGALRQLVSWTIHEPRVRFDRMHLVGAKPSNIIEPHQLMTEIDLLSPLLHATPSELGWEAYGVSFDTLERVLTCSNELRKFVLEGQPALLATEYTDAGRAHRAAHPERYLATAVEAHHAHLSALYATHLEEIPRVKEEADLAHGPPKFSVGVLNRDSIRAHDAWVDRGKTGEGRMVLKNQRIFDTNVPSIKGGLFENVTFQNVRIYATRLSESEFLDVKFLRAMLQTSSFVHAALCRVVFEECNLNLADFDESSIVGSRFSFSELARTQWDGARVQDTIFEEVKLHDATLNGVTMIRCDFRGNYIGTTAQYGRLATTAGARFEDCDFRETGWHQRDLSGATFLRCQFAGSGQMPRAWDGLVLDDCDLSRDQFLVMLGDHDARTLREQMTLSSDDEFAAAIADTVALVARGDIAAFEIPGQTTVEAVGQRRFQQIYDQLAAAARTKQRKVILRWVFDLPGTPAAQARTGPNLERLTSALEELARRDGAAGGALPADVRVQFAKLGPISAALSARLATLGVEVVG